MTLLQHIKKLEFNKVHYAFKSVTLSQYNFCHQNCEKYCKNNSGVELVHGWIEKNYSCGDKDFLLHSCIREDGVLVDITPWDKECLKGNFAIDESIILDADISSYFHFSISIFGKLPNVVKDTEI